MLRKSSLLALAAAAVAGTAMTASAAPIVKINLHVFTADGSTELLPAGDGKIHVSPGTQIQVVVTEQITATPNLLASTRGTAVKNKPLGIQTLSTSIVSLVPGAPTGTLGGAGSGGVQPVNDQPSGQAQQLPGTSYNDTTPDGFGYPFVNLNDLGADGDKDVQGTGYSNVSLTAPATATAYGKVSYGANGELAVVNHLFTALSGTTELRTATTSLTVYRDQNTTTMAADNDLANVTEGSVIITVPEPASMGLLGLGLLGMAARRRRA